MSLSSRCDTHSDQFLLYLVIFEFDFFFVSFICFCNFEFECGVTPQMSDLEQYAESTAASLLYLALECGGVAERTSEHVASHLGKV